LARGWHDVYFGESKVVSANGSMHVEVPVHLGGLDPRSVAVELFAEGPVRKTMDRGAQLPDNAFLYTATIDTNRPASDFTARLIPHHPNASVPLEASEISWQK